MSQYSKEFILFVSTIAGEAGNSSSASWKAIAHVIMNRFKYKEWRRYQTINDVILKTGFDAATQKNQPFLSAYNSLSAGKPSPLVLRIIAAVRPIYDGMIKDPTGKVVLYYSPRAQSSLSRSKLHSYKPTPAWNFNLLEEVKIAGTENDDFKWYRYKNADKSKRLQIVNLDGEAIPNVPYEITHEKQGQEKVIIQGQTDQEGKTKEIPYQHAGKDVKVKINPNADKHMPKANIEGMISVTEIITKLISPYLKQRVILKPNGKPGNYAGMYHKVKKGETLTKIAQKLGTTVEALLHANPKIADPNKIYIGQKIRLPAKTGRPVARKENGEVKIDRPTKPRGTNTQPPAEKVQTKPTVNTGANTQTGNREVQIEKPKAQESGNQSSARKVQMSPSSDTETASRPKEDNGAKHTSPQLRQRREVKRVNSVDGKPVTVVKENRGIHDQNETKINKLHPQFQDKVRRFIQKVYEQHQIKLRIVQGYRTYREQDELYAKGRTMPGSIVTKAKGGQSNHNFGLAIDVFPIWQDGRLHMKKEDDAENIRLLKLIAHVGIEEGLAWGGNWRKFKDYPHFELKVGKNMAQLRAAVKAACGDTLAVKYDI